MRYGKHLKAIAALPLLLLSAACVSTAITNDVPECDKLIPASLLEPVPGADLPEITFHKDGHEDAQPWREGFLEQSVQKEKADERAPAVDHIYKQCLELHRKALKRSNRGAIGRLFSERQLRRFLAGRDSAYRQRFDARLTAYRADLRLAEGGGGQPPIRAAR